MSYGGQPEADRLRAALPPERDRNREGEATVSTIRENFESYAQSDHPAAFDLCICGLPRWRHPSTDEQREIVAFQTLSTQTPHHLYIPPDLGDSEHGEVGPDGFTGYVQSHPDAAAIFEALRVTAHIPERGIRAAYIAKTLEIDGYVLMRRSPNGRFAPKLGPVPSVP